MPVSRFSQVSRYRNATLTVAKADGRYMEVGLSSSPLPAASAKLIAVAPHSGHIIAKTAANPGSFAVLLPPSSSSPSSSLPSSSSSSSSSSFPVSSTDRAVSGELAFGKFGKRPPGVDVGVQVVDFDVGAFQSEDDDQFILGCISTSGELLVDRVMVGADGKRDLFRVHRCMAKVEGATGVVDMIKFCPALDGVFATASSSDNIVYIWEVGQAKNTIKLEVSGSDDGTRGLWCLEWSSDGKSLATASKDGHIRLWDLATATCTAKFAPHTNLLRPIRVVFASAQKLVTCGFGAMRQREVAVWSLEDTSKARKRTTMDVSTAPLEPYVERDRGLVYLVSRGDASVRWIDAGSTDQGGPEAFAEGHFSLLDVVPTTGSVAISAPSTYDTTCGEVARLVVCSQTSTGGAANADSVVPMSVRVPRRQYIDFHQDLYPPTVWRGPGSGQKMGVGLVERLTALDDLGLDTLSLDPATKSKDEARLRSARQKHVDTNTTVPLEKRPSSTTTESRKKKDTDVETSPNAEQVSGQGRMEELTFTSPAVEPPSNATPSSPQNGYVKPQSAPSGDSRGGKIAAAADALAAPAKAKSTSLARTEEDENPAVLASSWSRRSLAGSTPLVPTYQNLTGVDISRSPDARMLAATSKYFFVPISGPGGRLAICSREHTGRLPLHLPCFTHGAPLGDFAVDPFDDATVYTSAADGQLRAWQVPSLSDEALSKSKHDGVAIEEAERTIKLPGSATNISHLAMHPNVKGLAAAVVTMADPLLHLVDFHSEQIVSSIDTTTEGLASIGGLFSAEWSPDGSVLALAGKDRHLYLIDVRTPDGQVRVFGRAMAHDAPRSFRIVWLDGHHIVTVGHGQGSSRQLLLFRLDFLSSTSSLTRISTCPLDVSPALLFPHWDADTCILYLWSKGERIVHAYEVHPEKPQSESLPVGSGQQTTWLQLPQFQHGEVQLGLAWLAKSCVDVQTVEVSTSIRLCRTEAQRISWKITRSRPEYFQDDVFPPTRLQRQPLLSLTEWRGGNDGGVGGTGLHARTSLKPDAMTPLSQAPPTSSRQSSLPKGPITRGKTAAEREQEALDEVFERAKRNDEGAKNVFDSEGARRAPDDDDWGDSD